MNDQQVVAYILEHLSDIWGAAVWIGGACFVVVCAIAGVLGGFGKAFLAKLLKFQADILAEVKKIGGDCAETNAALRGLTAKHDALKESHEETKQELNKVWAVVTLREVVEPQIERVTTDIADQKKMISEIISVNAEHESAITNLKSRIEQHDRRWHDLERDGVERRHANVHVIDRQA